MRNEFKQVYWPFIIISYFSLMVLGFLDNLRGPFLGQIAKDLSLSDTFAALFFIVPSLVAFVSSHYTPALIKRWETLMALRSGLFFMFLGFLGFSQMSNLLGLLASGLFFGFGFGLVSVAQNIAISESATERLRKQLFSGLHSIYALASLLAPFIISYLSLKKLVWSEIYFYMSAVPLLVFFGSFYIQDKKGASFSQKSKDLPLKVKRKIYFLALAFSFYLWAEIGLSSRVVLYLTRERNMALVEANNYLMLFFFLLFFGRVVFTFKHFKMETLNIILSSMFFSAVFFALGFIVSPWFFSLCGLAMAPFFPISMEFLTEIFGKLAPNAISSTVAFGSLGVVVMHYTVGFITEHFGIGAAFYIAPIAVLLNFSLFLYYKLVLYKKESLEV